MYPTLCSWFEIPAAASVLEMNSAQSDRKNLLVVNLGLAANIFLAILKTSIGILGHSPALLSDGINSTSDVAYYIVIRVFMRLAHQPADSEHPYGHSQLDSIAALVVGSFVITTAFAVFWSAIDNVYDLMTGESKFAGAAASALWGAFLTIVLKIGLTFYSRWVGQQTKSVAVLALAYDHRNDIFSASAAACGIFLGRMGYAWGDPLAGAFVALIILHTGIKILRESSADLMDTIPGRSLAKQITALLEGLPDVKQIGEIHAHRFGPYLVVNITIGLDGHISVAAGDEIASQVENLLCGPVKLLRRVYVHYHPAKRL